MSLKEAMLMVAGGMYEMPEYKRNYVRKCLECGEKISTHQISPFCGDDCRIKHAEKNKAQSACRKEKKQKHWKRK